MMALGAGGVISIVSNLLPHEMGELVRTALEGKFSEARKWHEQLLPFFRLALIETNPIPIKEAMHYYGLPAGPCRLPLSSLQEENKAKLLAFLAKSEISSLLRALS
jgi:4-hydroxy-tetrahydrodipicolinate synthase